MAQISRDLRHNTEAVDVKQVGRELGVRYVLEGSVRKAGGRLRITAQLIDAHSGAHLWADHFDGSLEDVFELQDNVAISVAGVIEPTLQAAEIRRSSERLTSDLTAYDLYLRALPHVTAREQDRLAHAFDLLGRAIVRDPHYGPALTLTAYYHYQLDLHGWADDRGQNRRKSVDLARQALRCAPDDPEVLAHAAHVLGYFDEDLDAAVALVDRALVLNPSYANGWYWSGVVRNWVGRPDLALEHFANFLRLSPRERFPFYLNAIGIALFFARRFERGGRETTGIAAAISEPGTDLPLSRCFLCAYGADPGSTRDRRAHARAEPQRAGERHAVPEPAVPRALPVGPAPGRGRGGMSQTRRLAAILAADVAGYSRLMGADEEGTLERLKALRRELLDPRIAEHRGRIVKTTGDGVLVEFASVVDAVRCAVEVQQAMPERNTGVAAESRIELRIGINLGDVIVEGDDLYGDGVNIAARIEALADAGGVFVSNTVYDHVRDRLPFVFEDLGEQQVKNIARPVRVYRVRGAAAKGPSAPAAPALPLPDKPSIAVLPFANMSGDPEQEYFADGMVEEIITALSRIRWLFVIARNSLYLQGPRSRGVAQRRIAAAYRWLDRDVTQGQIVMRCRSSSAGRPRERWTGCPPPAADRSWAVSSGLPPVRQVVVTSTSGRWRAAPASFGCASALIVCSFRSTKTPTR